MESSATGTPRSTHPMVIIAAIAVTVFSLVGIGAVMGWIPTSTGTTAPDISTQFPASPAAQTQTPVNDPIKAVEARPVETPKAAVKPVPHKPPVAKVAAAPEHAPNRVEHTIDPAAPATVAAVEPVKAPCYECGTIESIREIEKPGQASGAGAVAGGLLGGLLGHQVGNGRGRDVMAVVGAVGGAVAGNQVEKNVKKAKTYEIMVRFEDGTTQTIPQETAPAWRTGDKVRVVNGQLQSNG